MAKKTLDVRKRIVKAAAELLASGGREAVSSRAVSAIAKVQPPAIYRQFGDMRGLLDAVAHETFANYVYQKAIQEHEGDPIEDLRRGWDLHVAFGLANPAVYALIYSDPIVAANTPAVRDGVAILHRLVDRVAQAGQLRVSVPHAVRLIAAAGEGVTLALITTPPEMRDLYLSDAMREAVLAAITSVPTSHSTSDEVSGPKRVATRAVALHAVLAEAPGVLSVAEQHLLSEWLDRLAGMSN